MLMADEEEAGFCGMCDGVIVRKYKPTNQLKVDGWMKTIKIIKLPKIDAEIHIKEDESFVIGRGKGLFRVTKELVDKWEVTEW